MASTITLPTAATINVVATTSDYSAKSNLTAAAGSNLTEATMLIYDEILRYQRGGGGRYTHGLTEAMIDDFDYDQFAGNVLWFMDELVGLESDWRKDAAAGSTTAYGYAQFTEDSVQTAVNRYRYHIDKFNSRSILGRRDWQPTGYVNADGVFGGTKMKYPDWLITLENALQGNLVGLSYVPYYDHKLHLGALTYDQQLALAFVHLHREGSKDYNFVQLAKGDVTAAVALYENNHHTPAKNIAEGITHAQKKLLYFSIKRLYQPLYGVSTSPYYDERYFNYLKGYVGSFLYKEYWWFNTNDKLNIAEFVLINAGNALYQVFDIIFEKEDLNDAFIDWFEQGRGTFKAATNKKETRPEILNLLVEVQLYDNNGNEDRIVFAGFDKDGNVVVKNRDDTAVQNRIEQFFKLH